MFCSLTADGKHGNYVSNPLSKYLMPKFLLNFIMILAKYSQSRASVLTEAGFYLMFYHESNFVPV